MREQIVALPASSPVLVLGVNRARRGYKIEPLGTDTPVVVVSTRCYKTVALADVAEVQTFSRSAAPTSGTFKIKTPYGTTAAIDFDASANDIRDALRAIPGLGAVTVANTLADATLVVTLTGAPCPFGPMTVVESTLVAAGQADEQTITPSEIPDAGTYRLRIRIPQANGSIRRVETGRLPFDMTASALSAYLTGILGFTVTATGTIETQDLELDFGNRAMLAVEPFEVKLAKEAATDNVQLIEFDAVPDEGEFTLTYGEDETAAIAFNANAAAVEAALREIEGLEDVTVSGDFTDGFEVTFVDIPDPLALEVGQTNTLAASSTPVVITISDEVEYVEPQAVTLAVARSQEGVADQAVTIPKAAVTTPGDRTALNETVAQGAVLDQSASARQGVVYAYATADVSIKVTEVF